MPDFARALARLAAGRGSPRDLALLRDGLAAAEALKRELEAEPDRPPLLDQLLPQLGGHDRHWSSSLRARSSPRRRSTHRRAATSPKAMIAALDALRDAASNGRRAIAALEAQVSRRDRDQLAQDPPQCGPRLSCRSVGAACRQADGARQRLHPSPDPRRRGPLQLARASRGGEPGDRGRGPRARRRSGACRGADGTCRRRGPADHRDRRGHRAHRCRRQPCASGRRGRLDAAPADRAALPGDRGRPASRRRSGAARERASASSPTTSRSARRIGCG